ncbi:TRAP transporter large permease [Pusillimonas sp. MFBS29]|uniref:TRAP transporter large permease n=1 Tax=Pusillimonas sp. MFBS29 TaxID=2886690 RepID=UPI001D1287DA|nr:TRAP transporter large permease [Pusillimonas sp. MFBS29]MCC2594861.1 TRAP transporter large permease [Pusillimonas sp. MFBS29]
MEAVIMLLLLFVFLTIGIPIAFSIGLSVLTMLMLSDVPLLIFAQRAANAADSFSLLAIPLFVLAGELMNHGGLTKRLIGFAQSLIGHLRGGLGQTGVFSSLIFANVSGSAVADTTAIGSVLIPAMVDKGYKRTFVASLQASAGCLAPIVPPSILLILYGSIVNVSIGALFLGALIPGYLIALGLMVAVHVLTSPKYQPGIVRERFAGRAAIKAATIQALPALAMPLIIIGGIAGGIFTATEAGSIAVVYAFFIGRFYYRGFRIRDLPQIIIASAGVTVMVMAIIAFAAIFGWLLAWQNVPEALGEWIKSFATTPYMYLSIVIVFVLVLGTVMEVLAIATIFGPLLHTLAVGYGFDPIFFGVILAILMQIGGATPPVGILLNVTCGLAGVTPGRCIGYMAIFVGVYLFVALMAIAFPSLVTFLPHAMLG